MSPYSLSVHYTNVNHEVVGSDNQLYDVSSDEKVLSTEPKSLKAADIKVKSVIKVSVACDVGKIDELAALQFLSKVRFYMNDPELLLL